MKTLGVILIAALIAGLAIFFILKNLFRKWANILFGTSSIMKGLKQQEERLAETPKSVASMTKIYMPLITKDFPEFNLFEFKQKAENMLKSVFNAIENQSPHLVVNASEDLRHQVAEYIEDLKSQGFVEHYDDIKIHTTEIHKYQKEAGTCVIIFQTAVEYYYYRTKDGEVVKGRRDLKLQTMYNINLVYIQDIRKLKTENTKTLGLNCPNCGAPVTSLGNKYCEYCGSGIREVSVNTWFLNKYEEI